MKDFQTQMRYWVAYTSVGPSTVRGQRSPGLVSKLRSLLADVDLAKIGSFSPDPFASWLDAETLRIKQAMPRDKQHWGVARKVLNIFLRGATYNSFLRADFRLGEVESVLELPLDSLTAKGLRRLSPPRSLPRWNGVKHLTQSDSDRFQQRANEIALKSETSRVHLDIYLFLDRG